MRLRAVSDLPPGLALLCLPVLADAGWFVGGSVQPKCRDSCSVDAQCVPQGGCAQAPVAECCSCIGKVCGSGCRQPCSSHNNCIDSGCTWCGVLNPSQPDCSLGTCTCGDACNAGCDSHADCAGAPACTYCDSVRHQCGRPPPTPVPATPSPHTPAPPTPTPRTHAPETPAPATVHPTPAPDTPAPPTHVPRTHAPATDAPGTEAPATKVPATDAPATPAPHTDAPDTVAPSPAPGTAVPATPAPATVHPTPAPATDAPLSPAPHTAAPETPRPAPAAHPGGGGGNGALIGILAGAGGGLVIAIVIAVIGMRRGWCIADGGGYLSGPEDDFAVGDVVAATRRILFGTGKVVEVGSVGHVTKVPGDEEGSPCEVCIHGILFDAAPHSVRLLPKESGRSSPAGATLTSLGAEAQRLLNSDEADYGRTPTPLPAKPSQGLWTVVGKCGCVVREDVGLESAVVGRLTEGSVVRVLEHRGGRVRVTHPMSGWVSLRSTGKGKVILAPTAVGPDGTIK